MRAILRKLSRRESRIHLRAKKFSSWWRWHLARTATLQLELMAHRLAVFRSPRHLRSVEGRRFLEMEAILRKFLIRRISDPEFAKLMASQLLNVLERCDQITYDEPGTAEAYALLHFLDRYHRFQLIFGSLHKQKLMPMRSKGLEVLDVGTGPGPSMFAASDFYLNVTSSKPQKCVGANRSVFSIDYVERSQEFRNWLHHFTEFANSQCPTQKPWLVPYHHGTFRDFQNLEFNQTRFNWEWDDDGDSVAVKYGRKHRFDLIVFSNFLTTKEQTQGFSSEIENCARYLRNNGLLIVVGAKRSSRKYNEVYETIENAVILGRYNTRKLVARCRKVQTVNPIMGYSWNDPYGERLKELTKCIMAQLQFQAKEYIPEKAADILRKSVQPEYSRAIEWELLVFRKKAKPRSKMPRRSI